MCRVLRVSTSGFYDWLKDPDGMRGREDVELSEQISKIFEESKETYGSRRIRRALRKLRRYCSRRRIRRLMRRLGLWPKRRRRFRITTNSKHGFDVYPNLLECEFRVDGLDQVVGERHNLHLDR